VASGTYAALSASVDFLPSPIGPSVIYVALIFGEGASSDAILIKVQDNTSDGMYDRVFLLQDDRFGGWSAKLLLRPRHADRVRPHDVATSRDGGDVANARHRPQLRQRGRRALRRCRAC
jgi:hypothetical protein